ncbi:hypothetical protein BDV33DRAFT_199989 [Aspergillus novoparasiticus]|uniref:Uncharacterized protein n=1 Tax=Aspergillus novoparasiticus TaxID=986946 RepID=A0A5N6F279_9EURO|nr:hypothetical protein BDV33DRAFT_199989 [Aspergillus novoparasiticus]
METPANKTENSAHHWNCDFSVPKFRWASYNDQSALNNRLCFFLVDYGESQNDDDVPVLSYEWTGESLKSLPQLAKDPKIQAKLKEDVPFTYRRRLKREKPPIRKLVKSRLYCEENLLISEMDHMRESPEDLEWLKTHVRPRFWRKFVAEGNANKPPDAPDIQE